MDWHRRIMNDIHPRNAPKEGITNDNRLHFPVDCKQLKRIITLLDIISFHLERLLSDSK
jgi:hypothetical protein